MGRQLGAVLSVLLVLFFGLWLLFWAEEWRKAYLRPSFTPSARFIRLLGFFLTLIGVLMFISWLRNPGSR